MIKTTWPNGMENHAAKTLYDHSLINEAKIASMVAELDSKLGTILGCNRCTDSPECELSFNPSSHCYRLGTFFFTAKQVCRFNDDGSLYFYT